MSESTLELENRADATAIPGWAWPHLLSLDAPLVVVVWQAAIASVLRLSLPWHHVWILASAVWMVYVADRLLDARRLDLSRPHSLRHAFHRRFGKALLVAGGIALLTTIAVALRFLTVREWQQGAVVTAAVAVYAAYVHAGDPAQRRLIKELLAGIVFAMGISLPCWQQGPAGEVLVLALLCGGLCGWNCLLVASWDREADRAQRFASLPTALPGVSQLSLIFGMGLTLSAWCWCAVEPCAVPFACMVTLSCLMLAWLEQTGSRLPPTLRAMFADLALLTPLLSGWPW